MKSEHDQICPDPCWYCGGKMAAVYWCVHCDSNEAVCKCETYLKHIYDFYRCESCRATKDID